MSAGAMTTVKRSGLGRTAIWLLAGGGVLLVAVANWHLVHVAIDSQPDCVAHVRQGEGDAAHGRFSAAQSACAPMAAAAGREGTR
jgi:hypothetical protein